MHRNTVKSRVRVVVSCQMLQIIAFKSLRTIMEDRSLQVFCQTLRYRNFEDNAYPNYSNSLPFTRDSPCQA